MRLTLTLLGHVLDLSLEPVTASDNECSLNGGTTSAYPIGYAPSYGDQRWEPGPGDGEL